MSRQPADTVDPAEIERFSALADRWWDPAGAFRPLHLLNPIRLAFIRDRVAARFARNPIGPAPLRGLRIIDVGCGGGLLCEPLARLGATVTGIDAAEASIAVAKAHAAESGVAVDYRATDVETLADAGGRFDVVVCMEVIEHVADLPAFVDGCARLVAPGGAMALATLNRTAKSFLLAIVGAEYVLRWLPRGTHDWRRFVRPSELSALLRANGLRLDEVTGVVYNPLMGTWNPSPDISANYMVFALKD